MIPILSAFFSGLKVLAIVMAAPITLVCCIGLIGFTYKIVRDLKVERRPAKSNRVNASYRPGMEA